MNNWEELGFAKKPKVIDMVEQFSIIDELLTKYPILEWNGPAFMNYSISKGYGARGALMIAMEVFKAVKIARANNNNVQAAVAAVVTSQEISGTALSKLIDLYDKYEEHVKSRGLLDFDDQPLLAFQVLRNHPDYIKENYLYKYIIVDEFQGATCCGMKSAA